MMQKAIYKGNDMALRQGQTYEVEVTKEPIITVKVQGYHCKYGYFSEAQLKDNWELLE